MKNKLIIGRKIKLVIIISVVAYIHLLGMEIILMAILEFGLGAGSMEAYLSLIKMYSQILILPSLALGIFKVFKIL